VQLLQLGFKLNKPQVWFCSPHPSSQYAISPAPNPPNDTLPLRTTMHSTSDYWPLPRHQWWQFLCHDCLHYRPV